MNEPDGESASEAQQLRELGKAAKDVLPVVGGNLRRLRTRKGYSLERLSRAAGVSRAMLSQIELAQSAPTISVLWKIASALNVPFSALLGDETETPTSIVRAQGAARLRSADGSFSSRPLFPFGQGPKRTELYELRLAPGGIERAQAHPTGTMENLVVAVGSVAIGIGQERHVLEEGDAILFKADVEHSYENLSRGEATMYLVMTYAVEAL
ncbi:MAG: family transcriptional regulator [Myxococcaceae bacterium]|nr:family transcriptional regulator [Myxococcaceae bacterium]